VGAHLGTLKGVIARTCAAVAALADTQCAHALMRSCLGSAKVQYALHTLPLRHTAVFAADVTATHRRDVSRLEAQRAGKSGGWLSAPPVAGQGLCLTCAHYSTLLKWHLGVPMLPADCAVSPFPLCGRPVDVFGQHAVSCKKSVFGDRHLGTQNLFLQVFTQSRIPHDREVDIAGNRRRLSDILLKAWDGRRDLAVELTIVHPKPVTGRPLRGGAASFLKDKGEQKCRCRNGGRRHFRPPPPSLRQVTRSGESWAGDSPPLAQ